MTAGMLGRHAPKLGGGVGAAGARGGATGGLSGAWAILGILGPLPVVMTCGGAVGRHGASGRGRLAVLHVPLVVVVVVRM